MAEIKDYIPTTTPVQVGDKFVHKIDSQRYMACLSSGNCQGCHFDRNRHMCLNAPCCSKYDVIYKPLVRVAS